MPRQANHHSCKRGTPVLIKLKSGEHIEGKFHETTGRWISVKVENQIIDIPRCEVIMFTVRKLK